MTPDRTVLVVEDERDLADLIVYNLQRSGYGTMVAADGHTAVQLATTHGPDLIILDLMLPGLSGIEVARQVSTHPKCQDAPIIMLTARGEETDQLAGLAAGADDYVTKPFSMRVLLARVAAKLRRTPLADSGNRLDLGPISVDLDTHSVACDGSQVLLTLTEFKLLAALLQAPKRVLSRTDLIERVMGPGIVVTARTIDVHIAAIRKKLGGSGGMIRTIRGVGYQVTPEPAPISEQSEPDESAMAE